MPSAPRWRRLARGLAPLAVVVSVASCGTNESSEQPPPPEPSSTTTELPDAATGRTTSAEVVLSVDDVDGLRTYTATADGRSASASVELAPSLPDGVALVVEGEPADGGLSLLVVAVAPDVASVVLFTASGMVADQVAPVDGVAAVASVSDYDRVEARDSDGAVLTTCWKEPVDGSGARCISRLGAGS